jgi:NADH:ubiquinone oxidoreductase subunit E
MEQEQAVPEKEKVEKVYLLVCKGDNCSKKGNVDRVRVYLKQAAREFPAKKIQLSFVSCLGMCGTGPNVLVTHGGEVFHRCDGSSTDEIMEGVRGHFASELDR